MEEVLAIPGQGPEAFDGLRQALWRYLARGFEIHAHYHCFLVLSYEGVHELFEPYLEALSQDTLADMEGRTASWPSGIALPFRNTFKGHLVGRRSHWKAQALKRAREITESRQARSSDSMELEPEVVTLSIEKEQQVPPAADEKERRERLLAEYKSATGNPSNKRIYEAKNSGIHKPQFYEWLNGTLPSNSSTTVTFERFLRLKKPPIRRTQAKII